MEGSQAFFKIDVCEGSQRRERPHLLGKNDGQSNVAASGPIPAQKRIERHARKVRYRGTSLIRNTRPPRITIGA